MRWDASGTAATELGNLGTDSSGYTSAEAYAVNDAGTAVGYARKYDGGTDKGQRAVRWDASGTAATELGNLGTDSSGDTFAVSLRRQRRRHGRGVLCESTSAAADKGYRAVRWDASGTAATELGNLGTDSSGYTNCLRLRRQRRRHGRGVCRPSTSAAAA